jgi:hypothetical protein
MNRRVLVFALPIVSILAAYGLRYAGEFAAWATQPRPPSIEERIEEKKAFEAAFDVILSRKDFGESGFPIHVENSDVFVPGDHDEGYRIWRTFQTVGHGFAHIDFYIDRDRADDASRDELLKRRLADYDEVETAYMGDERRLARSWRVFAKPQSGKTQAAIAVCFYEDSTLIVDALFRSDAGADAGVVGSMRELVRGAAKRLADAYSAELVPFVERSRRNSGESR